MDPAEDCSPAQFILDLLACRIGCKIQNNVSSNSEKVDTRDIEETGPIVRALYLKALCWYIDQQCMKTSGAYIVFVTQRKDKDNETDGPSSHPALPLSTMRALAAQLDIDNCDQDFDAFMACSGPYFSRESRIAENWKLHVVAVLILGVVLHLAKLSLRIPFVTL